MRRSIHRSMTALAGLLVLLSIQTGQVRAEDDTRDTIIQGVRDDIRRKIQESNEKPAEKPEELAARARQQQTISAPERSSPKQEPAK